MEKIKVIKTDKGRITIQKNFFGYPEIKIRVNNETFKIRCPYESIENIENVINGLLVSKII